MIMPNSTIDALLSSSRDGGPEEWLVQWQTEVHHHVEPYAMVWRRLRVERLRRCTRFVVSTVVLVEQAARLERGRLEEREKAMELVGVRSGEETRRKQREDEKIGHMCASLTCACVV